MIIKYLFLTFALAALLLSDVVNSFILKRIHQKKSALTNKIKIRYGSNHIREPEVILSIHQNDDYLARSILLADLNWMEYTITANEH